ncbi:basic proline-rich protein-like [Acinonyx jubatus]|uniref:Basic proline-rich protein-like n=1 Tax=Acinonyx jubatus TaxID=32536 RepID=A0ABM3NDX9_ACIJB|nr:basic proline-rich protein-like [Acinonyx jubatus]
MPFIGKGEDTCSHAVLSLSHHRQARHIPEGAHVPGAGLQRPTLSSATPSSRPARKPDPAEVQDRVASAPKEGPAGFRAGLDPSRPEELGHNRALAGKLGRGYSQLPEKRHVHLVLSKLRPAPAPRADQTGPAAFQREGPAPAEAPRGETPFQAGAGLALSPRSPTPQGCRARHRSAPSSQLSGTFPRNPSYGPPSSRAVISSPQLRKDLGLCPLGLGVAEGLLRNRDRVPGARSGCLHWHTQPFSLPGRPRPRGRVLPVHPKCLPPSPRFGLWRRSGVCEPGRRRSPGSDIGGHPPPGPPPPRGGDGSRPWPRVGGSVGSHRGRSPAPCPSPSAAKPQAVCVAAAVTHLLLPCRDLDGLGL